MVHMYTHYRLFTDKKEIKSPAPPPFLAFLLVVQMKPKLVFTAPAEQMLIVFLV